MFRPNRHVICVPMSFAANEQTVQKIYFPAKATILRMRSHVTKVLAGTDAGTLTLKDSSANAMTNGQISLPASTAVDNNTSVVPTDNNVVAADDFITLTSAKSTAGGVVNVYIEYKFTP